MDHRALLAPLLAFLLAGPAAAGERPTLVELFTSQGCSSCPPAEALLVDLARDRRDVLALGYHVDYWDRLGWKDPYSSSAATARQRTYAGTLGTGQVYTPQMVVDGRIDVLGSDRDAVNAAIVRSTGRAGTAVSLQLVRTGDQLSVSIGAGVGSGKILLVGYDRARDTAVLRGENAGRTIRQANIVRSVTAIGDWTGAELDFTSRVPPGETAVLILQAAGGRILGLALPGS